MTVLRILLRRSLLLWAIPIWIGLYTAALLSRESPWRGDPAWGIEVVGVFLMFAGTVLAAMVAWEAASRDNHLSSLNNMASRGRWHLVLRAAVGWGLAFVIYLSAIFVVLLVSGLSPFAVNDVSPIPIITGPVALLAAAAWGAMIGTRVGGVFAPVVAGISFLVLEYLDYGGLLPLGLAEEGATATLLGVRYSAIHFLIRISWLAAFICFCLLVAWASTSWAQSVSATALLILTILPVTLPASAKEAYTTDRYLDPSACAGDGVTICVIPQWSSQLPVLESVTRATQEALQRETSTPLKSNYVGWTPGAESSENTIDVVSQDFAARPAGAGEVVQDLVAPLGCPDWRNPDVIPPDEAFAGRALLTDWVLAQPELASVVSDHHEMPESLAALPSQQRQEYLTKVADGLMNCKLVEIPVLPNS
jgi:hypothetical protein